MSRKIIKARNPVISSKLNFYLVYDLEAYELGQYFAENNTIECQWYQLLIPDYSDKDNGNIFYFIKDIFIPEQVGTTVTIDSTPLQVAAMWSKVRKDRGLTPEDTRELMSNAGVWTHSHVKAAAIPSTTDEKNWLAMIDKVQKPKAMIITNHNKDLYCRIYDPFLELVIENPTWAINSPVDYSFIESALSLVSEKKVVAPPATALTVRPQTATQHSSSSTTHTSVGTKETKTILHYEYLGKR